MGQAELTPQGTSPETTDLGILVPKEGLLDLGGEEIGCGFLEEHAPGKGMDQAHCLLKPQTLTAPGLKIVTVDPMTHAGEAIWAGKKEVVSVEDLASGFVRDHGMGPFINRFHLLQGQVAEGFEVEPQSELSISKRVSIEDLCRWLFSGSDSESLQFLAEHGRSFVRPHIQKATSLKLSDFGGDNPQQVCRILFDIDRITQDLPLLASLYHMVDHLKPGFEAAFAEANPTYVDSKGHDSNARMGGCVLAGVNKLPNGDILLFSTADSVAAAIWPNGDIICTDRQHLGYSPMVYLDQDSGEPLTIRPPGTNAIVIPAESAKDAIFATFSDGIYRITPQREPFIDGMKAHAESPAALTAYAREFARSNDQALQAEHGAKCPPDDKQFMAIWGKILFES